MTPDQAVPEALRPQGWTSRLQALADAGWSQTQAAIHLADIAAVAQTAGYVAAAMRNMAVEGPPTTRRTTSTGALRTSSLPAGRIIDPHMYEGVDGSCGVCQLPFHNRVHTVGGE